MLKSLRYIIPVIIFIAYAGVLQAENSGFVWQGAADKKTVTATLKHDGKQFTTLQIRFSEAADRLNLKITSKKEQGKAVYETRYSTNLEGKNGLTQTIDRLCQIPGEYEIQISGKAASCTILAEQHAPIDQFIAGEQPGELVVTGTGGATVSVEPDMFSVKHPDFKKGMNKGITSPNGDIFFRLPAGYWVLQRSGNGTGYARLIPVSSGKKTTVRWAATPEISLESQIATSARRLEIRSVTSEADSENALCRFAVPAGLSSHTPAIDHLQSFERSLPAEIIDIKQSETPLHLVMLLDSSGSMKKSMKAAIDATVKFVEALPEKARVEVIDFDTKAKPIKAANRNELIKSIKAIKADGATALRDSILLGLSQLKGSPRPALVVFTDGFDANHNDTAPGSKAGEKEVFEALTKARIPVFTIGFDEGADRETLARLADLSGGLFQTADESNINEVFARLEATVAREYLLTYRRPQKPGFGVRPVISICVDTSGSMASGLESGVAGSRRDIARNALHSMIKKLPANALVQILDFDANTRITQTATANRARNHAGLAAFDDGGGTDVLKAVSVAMQGLLAVPSNRRYMLFLTDEAIKTGNKKDEEMFNRLLARMKDEGIFSMWIGMVKENENGAFHQTAAKAGGEAIIASNLSAMQQTVDKLLARVAEPADESTIPFELVWNMPQQANSPVTVSGNGIFKLPPLQQVASGTEEIVDTLQITSTDISAGSATTATNDSVDDGALENQQKTKPSATGNTMAGTGGSQAPGNARMAIDLDLNGQNSACSFHIRKMALYDSLNGVQAPTKKLFAAFDIELNNILPEQDVAVYPDGGNHPAQWVSRSNDKAKIIKAIPPYQIGDLGRHFYLRWNNDPAVPFSPAAWLLDDSLSPFGSKTVTVNPGKPLRGLLVFIVSDDQGLTNGAIDFFDRGYGHVSLTIAGKMEPADLKAARLPEAPTGKLGSAFNIAIKSCADVASPLAGATAGGHLLWRVIDGEIESQVQALLDIDPKARMHLAIPTTAGPVRLPLSAVTGLLPFGFYDRVKLSPGSNNYFTQAYLLPAELATTASGSLCIDMKNDDISIALSPAENFVDKPAERNWSAEGNGMKLVINSHGRLPLLNKRKGDWLIVDATIADLPDGSATRLDKLLFLGRADLKEQGFTLKPGERMVKNADNQTGHKGMGNFASKNEADGNQTRIYPDSVCRQMLFAANENAIVPDGKELRFVAVFRMPTKGDYLLTAEGMPFAVTPAAAEPDNLPAWLLAENDEAVPVLAADFEKKLAERLKQLANERRRQSAAAIAEAADKTTDADGNMVEAAFRLSPPVIAPWAAPVDNHFRIEVSIDAEPAAEGAAAQTGAAASALSGGNSKTRSFKVIGYNLPPESIARSPFEIIYAEESGKDGEKLLKTSLIGIWGSSECRESIDLKAWKPVKERIAVGGQGIKWPVIERDLTDNSLQNRIHSIALALPDISAEQTEDLQKRWKAVRVDKTPDHLSLWQWYAHARLAAFISAQTTFEKQLCENTGISLSREKQPRLMLLTGAADDKGTFEARLDLVAIQPEIKAEAEAAAAFRIAAGIFVSDLEAKIMQGKGVFQFWGRNRLQIVADSGKQKNAWLKFAASRGVSERVIKAIKSTRSVVLFPQSPALINDRPFWAWLEINPKTYETIGVLETGERGTIAGEAIIQALIPDGAGIALGFWKGTETAVWGMSAFILEGQSALEAAASTEKFIGDLSENLGKVGDSFEVEVGDASIDLLSGKVTLAGFSSEGDYSPWDGYKGFVTGFNAGASWYLNKVKAAASGK
ncbi:MAG TPA: VWA domain-containing protein [Candidatus Rifleibacterium sp.]|nr:VWA domain-containing protein [Candidatus Rifleibacterium sp.]HPT45950.1 VWA domain-containing protein [Candidatus Rifleibacterium sp.]